MTVDRVNELLRYADLPRLRSGANQNGLHDTLNLLDSAIGADTEWLTSRECGCLWHIGKSCSARRAVGARVRMLEEIVALRELKEQFAVG